MLEEIVHQKPDQFAACTLAGVPIGIALLEELMKGSLHVSTNQRMDRRPGTRVQCLEAQRFNESPALRTLVRHLDVRDARSSENFSLEEELLRQARSTRLLRRLRV